MKQLIRPVKGTRDFYPGDMAFRTWLYGQMKAASQKFGYPEFEAPLIETLELYAAKSGEELVKEQSFVFQDRGGDTITLRPELTPSLSTKEAFDAWLAYYLFDDKQRLRKMGAEFLDEIYNILEQVRAERR